MSAERVNEMQTSSLSRVFWSCNDTCKKNVYGTLASIIEHRSVSDDILHIQPV